MTPKSRQLTSRLTGTRLRGALSDTLTRREREVVACNAMGFDMKKTAKVLHISPNTVKNHEANIREKLGVATMFAAIVRYLFARGRI